MNEAAAQITKSDLTDFTRDWLLGLDPSDYDIDALGIGWLELLEASTDEDTHQRTWAFLLWGQSERYTLAEEFMDIAVHTFLEQAFIVLAQDMPMWDCLQQFDRLHHAQPDPIEMDAIAPPQPDTRGHVLREPFPSHYAGQWSFLQPFTSVELSPVSIPSGLPVIETEDGVRHLYIAHLYSGRRRPGDCHDVAHRLFESYFPGWKLHFLSVDTAIDPKLGNLMGEGYTHLHRLAALGALALTMNGPPCETWSGARYMPLPELPSAPRPLRTLQRPWGVHGLSTREVRQLATGTSLLLRSMKVEITALLQGGSNMKEHPAPPPDDEEVKPSIWHVALHSRYMKMMPEYKLHTFMQYKYGATAVKPTVLQIANLPGFSKHFSAEALAEVQKPSCTLQGFDVFQKQFRTASAKEYPSHLCTAMVRASLKCLDTRRAKEDLRIIPGARIPADTRAWIQALETRALDYRSTFLADYQPQR